jgi:putative membrane protein
MIVYILIGILLGIFSGLLPGIHANTIATILTNFELDQESAIFLLIAMLGSQIIFSFLPAIFFSVPDETVVLSVLPGHKMALQGRGKEALNICVFSVLLALFFSILLLPLSFWIMPILYEAIKDKIWAILVLLSIYMIFQEKGELKILSAIVFILAGFLGIATLNNNISDPLFPAFSGLFATSGIILSFTLKGKLPPQKSSETKFDFLNMIIIGVILGMLSDLLPGFAAPAQIALFASFLIKNDERKFLSLISAISSSHAVFSIASFFTIGKAREGVIAILKNNFDLNIGFLWPMIGVFAIAVGISSAIMFAIAKLDWSLLSSNKISGLIFLYLVITTFLISGFKGLVVLFTATVIGILPPLLGIRRTNLMGFIILPSILTYI